MIFWLWNRVKQSLWPTVIALILSLLTAAMGLALMGLAGWTVSSALIAGLGGGAAATTFSLGVIMLHGHGLLRALAIGRSILRYAERMVGHDAVFRMIRDLRIDLFRRLGRLSLTKLYRLHLGDVLGSLVRDVDSLDGLLLRIIFPVATLSVTALWLLVLLDGALAWVTLGVVITVGVAFPALTAWLGHRPAESLDKNTTALNAAMLDFVLGQRDLAAASAGAEWIDRLMATSHSTSKNLLSLARLDGLATASVQLVGGIGALALLSLLSQTPETPLDLEAFGVSIAGLLIVVAVMEICAPIPAAFKLIGALKQAVSRLLALDQSAVEDEGTELQLQKIRPNEAHQFVLDDVSYSYPTPTEMGRSPQLLCNISLSLTAGDRLAIVGPSGSGKSTLAALMSGFLLPDSGAVRLFGQNVCGYDEEERFRRICYIPQGGGLFDVSLRDNLQLADPNADDAKLEAALNAVGLGAELSDKAGLDLRIGEKGNRLSGGQGRRLSVARALLRNPNVLIVDEPTDGLDSVSARDVLASISHAAQDCVLIVISHDNLMNEFATQTLDLKDEPDRHLQS